MEQTMRLWEPILTGSMRVKAENIVDTLASRLSRTKSYNTFGEHLSTSTFYSHLNRCSPDSNWSQFAEYHAGKALELAAPYRDSLPVGLFWGISGLAWGVLYNHDSRPKANLLNAFNTLILQRIQITIRRSDLQQKIFWGDEYDLISGVSGAGAYLLRYLKEVDHPQGLDQVIDFLVRLSCVDDGGPWGFWPRVQTRWDLGIAHGLPGPLSVLAKALAADLTHSQLKKVVSGLSLWIISHAREDAWGLNWPYSIEPNMDTTSESNMALAAWCYGSPGIARSLWLAGQALQAQEIKDVAIQAMVAVCQRPRESWRIDYPFFCHGTAGMLEILLRFYNDTRIDIFADTAMFLASQLMNEFDPNLPYGFRSRDEPAGVDTNTVNLVMGSTGVLLTLLACCTSVEPEWDELFGIS